MHLKSAKIEKSVFNYINDFLSIADYHTLLKKICKETPEIINGKECSIFLIPDIVNKQHYNGELIDSMGRTVNISEIDHEFIVLAGTTRKNFKNLIGKAFYIKGHGLTGWIFKNKKPLVIEDMQSRKELFEIDPDLIWSDAYMGAKTHYPHKNNMPFIGVPLIKGEKILGVIRVGEPLSGSRFSENALEVLMSFAGILANLIEKITAIENKDTSLKSLIKLGAIRNEDQIYDAVVHEAASLVGADNCELFFLDEFGEKIVLKTATADYMKLLKKENKARPYQRGDGLTGWIFKTGKPLRIEDIRHFKEQQKLTDAQLREISDDNSINSNEDRVIKWLDQDEEYKHRSIAYPYFLGVPIKSDIGEVIGVLRVSSPRAKMCFDRMDMHHLMAFARNVSFIHENMRQKKLYKVLVEIGNISDKNVLLNYVVNQIPGLVLGRGCSIFLKQPGTNPGNEIQLAYTNSPLLKIYKDSVSSPINLSYRYGDGKTGFVADIKRPLLINYYGKGRLRRKILADDFKKYEKDPNVFVNFLKDDEGNKIGITRIVRRDTDSAFSSKERSKFNAFCKSLTYEKGGLPSNKEVTCETGEEGFAQSFLAVPILSKSSDKDLLGVLRIPRTQEGGRFSEDDLALVESVTGRLTSLLEVDKTFQNMLKIHEIITDINKKINSSFDKDKILEEILRAITDKLGYEFACIQLVIQKKDSIDVVKVRKNTTITNAIDPADWQGASHPLHPPTGQKKDIHVHVLDIEEAKVIKGWDDYFDKKIYEKFNHKDLIRAFVPIIAVEPNTGELIKIGTLEAGHNINRKYYIDEQELEILKAVANQIAITFWNREQIWSRVIYSASHQLRNYLTRVLGIIQALFMGTYGPLEPLQEKRLDEASFAIRESANLLTNLLELVCIIREMAVLHVENANLNDLIDNIIKPLQHHMEAKQITFIKNTHANRIDMVIDASKVEHVLMNLIENAIKYSETGGRIMVSTRDHGDYIQIIVADTGPGIPKKEQSKIFNEFFQMNRLHHGTGLGLSIAQNFAKLHGGIITVESTVNEGATFYFNLPKSFKGETNG